MHWIRAHIFICRSILSIIFHQSKTLQSNEYLRYLSHGKIKFLLSDILQCFRKNNYFFLLKGSNALTAAHCRISGVALSSYRVILGLYDTRDLKNTLSSYIQAISLSKFIRVNFF